MRHARERPTNGILRNLLLRPLIRKSVHESRNVTYDKERRFITVSTSCPPSQGIGIDPLFSPGICCQRVAVVLPSYWFSRSARAAKLVVIVLRKALAGARAHAIIHYSTRATRKWSHNCFDRGKKTRERQTCASKSLTTEPRRRECWIDISLRHRMSKTSRESHV